MSCRGASGAVGEGVPDSGVFTGLRIRGGILVSTVGGMSWQRLVVVWLAVWGTLFVRKVRGRSDASFTWVCACVKAKGIACYSNAQARGISEGTSGALPVWACSTQNTGGWGLGIWQGICQSVRDSSDAWNGDESCMMWQSTSAWDSLH